MNKQSPHFNFQVPALSFRGFYTLVTMATSANMCLDGKEQNLMEWIKRQKEGIYEGIGKKTWRVPPVRFNVQKLREQKSKSSEKKVEYKVIESPPVTDQETNRAENYVCGAFESLSNDMVEKGTGSAMFLISNFEYDNYLNKLNLSHLVTEDNGNEEADSQSKDQEPVVGSPITAGVKCLSRRMVRLPRDVAKRGELDILILHQEAGIVLVQTKAVGYHLKSSNHDLSPYEHFPCKAIEKAGEQLSRDRHVMLHVMQDLGLKNEQMTSLLALPNLPRTELEKALDMSESLKHRVVNDFHLDPHFNILCAEDFAKDERGNRVCLERWWQKSLLPQACGLGLETMEQIAYRTVGLLSTVSVWSLVQPRMEVRNLNDAAWETGNRYTQVVLSSQQVELLTREDKYFYLWGPAGSGKTLLLSLKGRQWLKHNHDVVILNTRLGSKGRKVGVVMQSTINKTKGLQNKAKRIDLDLMKDEESLLKDITEHVTVGELVHFLIDEVTWEQETEKLMSVLKENFPDSPIWCAGMLEECLPMGFESGGLCDILRCPPSVQRVLRVIDARVERCQLYHIDSTKAGLPTDGPPPYFIIHSLHGDSSVQPYDCSTCAKQLADFLLNTLNMKGGRSPRQHIANQETCDTADQEINQSDSRSLDCTCDQVETNQSATFMTDFSGNKCNDIEKHSGNWAYGDSQGEDIRRDSFIDKISKSSDSGICSAPEYDGVEYDQTVISSECDQSCNDSCCVSTPEESYVTLTDPFSKSGTCNTEKLSNSQAQANSSLLSIQNGSNCSKKRCEFSLSNSVAKTKAKANKENTTACKPSPLTSTTCCTAMQECITDFIRTSTSSVDNTSESDISSQSGSTSATTGSKSGRSKARKRARRNKKRNGCCNNDRSASNDRGNCEATTSSTKPRPSNSKGGQVYQTGHRLNFGDAVLPATVPKEWHHYNTRGYWSISREALSQDMLLLGSRPFCQQLIKSGIPFKVEEKMVLEGKETENVFALCPLGAVHGLEYKVVVCAPSACSLPPQTEILQRILDGKVGRSIKMKRTKFAEELLQKMSTGWRASLTPNSTEENVPKIDKIRISTHVSEEGDKPDVLYEPVNPSDLGMTSIDLEMTLTENYEPDASLDIESQCSAGRCTNNVDSCGLSEFHKDHEQQPLTRNKKYSTTGTDVNKRLGTHMDITHNFSTNIHERSAMQPLSGSPASPFTTETQKEPEESSSLSQMIEKSFHRQSDSSASQSSSNSLFSSQDLTLRPQGRQLSLEQSSSAVSSSESDGPLSVSSTSLSPWSFSDTPWRFSSSSDKSGPPSQRSSYEPASPVKAGATQSSFSPSSPSHLNLSPYPSQEYSSSSQSSSSLHTNTASPVHHTIMTPSSSTPPPPPPDVFSTTSSQAQNEVPVPNTRSSLQKIKDEVCGCCATDNCVCKYFKPEELEALHRLDPWDQAYLLMCASRCTSQLVLVLP